MNAFAAFLASVAGVSLVIAGYAHSYNSLATFSIFLLPFFIAASLYFVNFYFTKEKGQWNMAALVLITVACFMAILIGLAFSALWLPKISEYDNRGFGLAFTVIGISCCIMGMFVVMFLPKIFCITKHAIDWIAGIVIIMANHLVIWLFYKYQVVSDIDSLVIFAIIAIPFHTGLFMGYLIRWDGDKRLDAFCKENFNP